MPDISRVNSLTALRRNYGSAGRTNDRMIVSTRARSTLSSDAGLISVGSAVNKPRKKHLQGCSHTIVRGEEGVAADTEKARRVRSPTALGRYRSCPANLARSNRSSLAGSSNSQLPSRSADRVALGSSNAVDREWKEIQDQRIVIDSTIDQECKLGENDLMPDEESESPSDVDTVLTVDDEQCKTQDLAAHDILPEMTELGENDLMPDEESESPSDADTVLTVDDEQCKAQALAADDILSDMPVPIKSTQDMLPSVERRHDNSTLTDNNDALSTIFTIFPEEAQCHLKQERIEGVEVSLQALSKSSGTPPDAIADKSPGIEKLPTVQSAPDDACAEQDLADEECASTDEDVPPRLTPALSKSSGTPPDAIADKSSGIEKPPTVQSAPNDACEEQDLADEECASTMDEDLPPRLTPIIISGMRTNSMLSMGSNGEASAITVKVANSGQKKSRPFSVGKSAYANTEPMSGTRSFRSAFKVVAGFVTEKLILPNTKCHFIPEESATYTDDDDVENLVFM